MVCKELADTTTAPLPSSSIPSTPAPGHGTPASGDEEHGDGVVVNFSSGWGRSTAAGAAPYCATKYAIEGLSLAAARDPAARSLSSR